MAAARQRIRILLGTRHGLTLLGRNWVFCFGLLSGAAQLVLALWPNSPLPRWPALLGLTALAALFAAYASFPRTTLSRTFTHPDVTVTVEIGDLFTYPCHLVIGFTDTFDTDTTDESLVAPRSVQGQLLHRIYNGDVAALDARLTEALTDATPVHTEPQAAKRKGKRVRYPVGTVAVIRNPERNYFCVAYGRMNNNLVVSCDTEQLWGSLALLWEAIRHHGHRDHVAMPITGSDLARINNMDQAGLVKLILLSFVAHSRARGVCGSLTIVVRPQDYHRIDMLALAVFLQSL
ncbi:MULTISPECIES: macro domain-containing protein [Streptomyces]|uniref:macro domain-containing protein n=1 Tax=Streptomyces TaxID=1883 RepID=UPI002930B493|nr:macro domain-containing protein [Streptomyces sp. NEAU-HV9]